MSYIFTHLFAGKSISCLYNQQFQQFQLNFIAQICINVVFQVTLLYIGIYLVIKILLFTTFSFILSNIRIINDVCLFI